MASNSSRRSSSSGSNSAKSRATSSSSKRLDSKRSGYYARSSSASQKAGAFSARLEASSTRGSASPRQSPSRASSNPSRSASRKSGSSQRSSSTRASSSRSRSKGGSSSKRRNVGSTYSAPSSRSAGRTHTKSASRSGATSSSSRSASSTRRAAATSRGASGRTKSSGAHRSAPARSRTIAELRPPQSVLDNLARFRGLFVRIAIIIGLVAAVCVVGFLLYNAPIGIIDEVTVEGNSYLSADEIEELADIDSTATIINPHKAQIEKNLTGSPWIQSVQVKRDFPTGIILQVNERAIVGTVTLPVTRSGAIGEQWAIAADGTWLALVTDPNAAANAAAAAAAEAAAAQAAADQAAAEQEAAAQEGPPVGSHVTAMASAQGVGEVTGTLNEGETVLSDEGILYNIDITTAVLAAETPAPTVDTAQQPDVTIAAGTRVSALDAATQQSISGTLNADGTVHTEDGVDVAVVGGSVVEDTSPDYSKSLTQRIFEDAQGVPAIADVGADISPTEGGTCDDPGILNALAIQSSVSDDLSSHIVSFSAASAEKTSFLMDNGVTVAFGAATDITAKERIINDLLAEHAGNISYINVRVVDRPAWRGLE